MDVAAYVRKHPKCNYFISASAGTGKTYAMTNYYLGVLEAEKDPNIVERILTTTFTVKAAAEMKQRISNEILKMEKNSRNTSEREYWKNVKSKMSRAIISTIDSFCQSVLREENFSVNVDPNLTIINDLKRDKVIERSVYTAFRLFFEAYEGKESDLPNVLKGSEREKSIKKHVETLKNDKKALKMLFSEYRLDKLQEMMKDVLVNWRTEMKRSSVLDYIVLKNKIVYDALSAFKTLTLIASEVYESMTSDISEFDYKGVLEKTIQTLKTEEVGQKYSERFKYILVDEYQDTNYLQKEIFDTLHNDSNYIFYVGDRKQSIYRFRGSDVTVFTTTYEEFKKKEKNGNYKTLSLRKNYRSYEGLVNYFNELVKETLFNSKNMSFPHMDEFGEEYKRMCEDVFFREEDISYAAKTENGEVPKISERDKKRVKYVYTLESRRDYFKIRAEAKTAAKIVKALVRGNKDLSYKDITILRRSLKSSENVYKEVFKAEGIPLYVVGGHSFYSRPEIEGIISALKAVQNPNNDYLFTLFFFSPLANGDLESLDKIVRKRDELSEGGEKISLFKACEALLNDLPPDLVKAHDVLKKYADLKYFIRPTEIVRGLVKDLDYVAKLSKWNDRNIALYNLKKLLSGVGDFDQMANSFSELIRLISKIKEKNEEEATLEDDRSDSVKLMTIHKSKGLEFKVVLLGGTFKKSPFKENDKEIQFSLPKAGVRYFMMKGLIEDNLKNKEEEIMKDFYINAFMNYTEERRLLYVAVTRASELFIPIFVTDSDESIFLQSESFSNYLKVKNEFYDLVCVDDIKVPVMENENVEEIFLSQQVHQVPEENLKSFDSLSYKMYIAPTFLKKIKDGKEEGESVKELTDEDLPVISIKDIFSSDEKSEGKKIHSILSSVQKISDLKYLEKEKIINPEHPLSDNPVIQRLFTYPVSKAEWRLMKPLIVEGKTYMLFGIPDRVFIKDGNIEIVDYKHSYLRGINRKERVDNYAFQIKFYLYLLSDFGKPKKGYIVSTKSGEIIEVNYEEDFESQIVSSIKNFERVLKV